MQRLLSRKSISESSDGFPRWCPLVLKCSRILTFIQGKSTPCLVFSSLRSFHLLPRMSQTQLLVSSILWIPQESRRVPGYFSLGLSLHQSLKMQCERLFFSGHWSASSYWKRIQYRLLWFLPKLLSFLFLYELALLDLRQLTQLWVITLWGSWADSSSS